MKEFLLNINPAIALAVVNGATIVIFLALWFLLKRYQVRLTGKWAFFDRFLDNVRRKGESRLIRKYGLFGLFVVIAVPVPTIGVYGGTVLCWLTGMKWWHSLITITSGSAVYNSVFLFSLFGIVRATMAG